MKIEPCLYCGGEMIEIGLGLLNRPDYKCSKCKAMMYDLARHNKIARILQTAEVWAETFDTMKFGAAEKALKEAIQSK